ncbi:MAG: hypothetical protein M1823_004293 [Watsoniomyces obsoletus]|nr:MAG: hypothetical protein M1823_004293 [Watsoniomyces obsoletus]
MSTAPPEEKRRRLSAWDGHTHPLAHHPHSHPHQPHQPPVPYPEVLAQPVTHPPYVSEADHRDLAPPHAAAPYPPSGSGYVTPAEAASTPYTADPGYGRPGVTSMKTGSPHEILSHHPTATPPGGSVSVQPPGPSHPTLPPPAGHMHQSLPPPPPQHPPPPPVHSAPSTLPPPSHPPRALSISTSVEGPLPVSSHAGDPGVGSAYGEPPPSLETHHGMSGSGHDGLPPSHLGSHAPSPVSSAQRGSYYSYMDVTAYPQRRKAVRAAQACDACRQRKAKCDEGRPSCGFCKETMIPCVYREVPPPKQDRTLLQILHKLDKLDHVEMELQELRHEMQAVRAAGNKDRVEGASANSRAAASVPGPSVESQRASIPVNASLGNKSPLADDLAVDGELSIPLEHTTAAHKLLRWPSIQQFVHPITKNEHYVMQGEERRGLLRLWGRGEGGDLPDGDPLNLVTPGAGSDQDDGFRGPGITMGRSESLMGGGPSPARAAQAEVRRPPVEGIGGLNPDGSLNLGTSILVPLMNSYYNNMHVLHPFMDQDRLTQMVIALGTRYPGSAGTQPRSPYAVPSPLRAGDLRRDSTTLAKAGKRKRSSAANTSGHSAAGVWGTGYTSSRNRPERCIGTALVLLVAALGKICDHKDYLPGPVPDVTVEGEPMTATTTSTTNTSAAPTDTSPPFRTESPPASVKHSPASSHSSGLGSASSPPDLPRAPYAGGRASSLEDASPADRGPPLTNADVIPGLAYYAYATEILGNLQGGNELAHVQAGLLAGLYAGQLGRVLESWKWINWACTSCQVLVRRTTFNKEAEQRNNLIIVAFWTCLQLESDILAELDLPPSGISRLEEVMPFPLLQPVLMWAYYIAQIALRKLLNRVHYALYKPGSNSKHSAWSMGQLKELEKQLGNWRGLLPPELQWRDSDPPPSDINAARLRAKYYGARYIIYRPFLHHALHPMLDQPGTTTAPLPAGSPLAESSTRTSRQPSPLLNATGTTTPAFHPMISRRPSEVMPPPAPTNFSHIDETVLSACRNCIAAALQSTAAFHGINYRPIVTNIFGTAHAQFGNLLVLQAATRHPVLKELVPQDKLNHLLFKTIAFLRNLSPISPTLKFDAKILELSMRSLPLPTTSFSSNDGRHPHPW